MAITPATPAVPATRTYYHRIPGSRFMYQIGPSQVEELYFLGGELTTSDPLAIAELDKIADKNGTGVTSDRARAMQLTSAEQAAFADARTSAEIAQAKMVAAGQSTA